MRGLCFLGVMAALIGCGSAEPIDFRVFVPPSQMPLLGADRIVVWRTEGGLPVRESAMTQPIEQRSIDLGEVPFGVELGIVIEARFGEVPLARGRSFSFDYFGPDAPPLRRPDVTLLRVGRSAELPTASLGARIEAITPSDRGALLALSDGRVLAFDAHAGDDGAPALVELASISARAGARWSAMGRALLGIGGASPGATLVSRAGVLFELSTAPVSLDRPASLIGSSSHDDALMIFGLAADARSLARVSWDGEQLSFRMLTPLTEPAPDARGVLVDTRAGPRALVVEADRVTVVDYLGEGTHETLALPLTLEQRAVAALESGIVVLAGGIERATGAASADVSVVIVRPDRAPILELLAPSAQPLFTARSGAAFISYASGLALIAGGRTSDGTPTTATELIDVRLDRLPGEVVVTGPLPFAADQPVGVALDDGSVLIGGAEGLALHAPAR